MEYYISSGVISTGITLDVDSMYISSGGTANSTTVNSGGSMHISSGGVANSTKVISGGMTISSGGVANSTIVIYGSMYISSGGVANSTTVNLWGSMHISSGGTANSTKVNSFCSMHISSGGVANSTTVINGGNMYISSGGTANSTKVKGGHLTGCGHMTISSGGVANSTTVNAYGNMYIENGGVANSTTVNSGGYMYISSGGTANSTTVNFCGNMYIYDGGVANSTTVNDNGRMYISSGGVANSTILNSFGSMHISSGGVANSTTINSGGRMNISSGGVANSTTVNSWGYMHISNGGVANGTVLSGYSATMDISSGGVHRGSLTIAGDAIVSAYEGGVIDFTVAARTTADSYLINDLSLISGTPIYTITVSADQAAGTYKLAQGAENFNGTISIGDGTADYGTITVNGAALTRNDVKYTLTQTNGNLLLNVAEIQPAVFIYSSGTLTSSGVEITGATLAYGGNNSMYISSGGVANSTTVNDSGSMFISSGGVANSTTVYGGYMEISSGGVATDITAQSGARLYITVASDTYIQGTYNGSAFEMKDAFISGYTVDGSMDIHSGGVANSTTVNSRGSMYISSGGVHCGSLNIADGAIVSAYEGGVIDFTVSGRSVDDGYLINNLSLISGTPTYTITVSADQAFGTYKLAQGAENFTGTISVGDGITDYGTLTVNGSALTYNNAKYKLTQTNGNLELAIGDLTAPELSITGNPTDWTNQDVVLKAIVNEDGCMIQYQIGNSEWMNYIDGVTMTDNGTVNFKVTDQVGNITEKSITVDKIDKIVPTLNISGNPTAWTNQDVTLTATVSDGTVEFYNGTKWVSGAKQTVSANGTYKFRVTDEAGNITEKSVIVDKIDKLAPTLDIAGNPTAWTNQDVVLFATVSDGKVEFFNGKKWVSGTKHSVAENGTYKFRVTDAAGNVTEKSVTVDKIDKIAPTLEVTGNPTSWTNQDVTLTATVSDGTVEYFNGSKWVVGDKYTVSENGTYKFRVTDQAGNVTEKSVTVDKIDKIAPTLNISGNPTAWTNQDVTLTATASDGTVEYFNGSEWVAGNKYTVSENGTYKFRVIDEAGNITEKSVTIDKIDKIAPTLDVTGNPTSWTNQNVILTATVSDGTVEFYNGNKWVSGAKQTVSANGTYKFRVTDEAGNITEKSVTVDKIDKIAPTLDVTGNPTSWTNQNVILTATVSDGTVEYFNGSKWVAGDKYTVSENGTYKFRVTDQAGNVTEKEVVVDKIDKVAPTLSISGNPTAWTNKDVTLTATVSDGTVEYFNGTKWVAGNKLTVSENGTYKFRVTDQAGNVTEKTVLVDKIDKVDPTLRITGNAADWTNQDVTLTATYNEGSVEFFNGSEWVAGAAHTVSENGTYKFRVTDQAGNVTEKEVVVDKIDKLIPDSPVLSSDMGAIWSNTPVMITATAANGTVVEYSFDKQNWYTYKNGLLVGENGEYYFRATDAAGNISDISSYVVNKIDPVADLNTTEYIFIKAKYNEKITGKKQNGVELEYKGNAFNSIADVPATAGKLIVAVDSKVNGNEYAGDLRVAANAVLPKIKETDNSYSYRASAAPRGTLNISASTGKTEFIRFSTVNVTGEGVTVNSVIGGKSSSSETLKHTVSKKGVVTDTEKFSYTANVAGKFTAATNATVESVSSFSKVTLTSATVRNISGGSIKNTSSSKLVDAAAKDQKVISTVNNNIAAGSITMKDQAKVENVKQYKTVTLKNSTAGDITNFTSKDSKSDNGTYDEAKNKVTRKVTLSHTETTAGTLKATDSTLGNVTGFATVNLKNVTSAGDFRRVDADGDVYSTVKESLNIKTDKKGVVTGSYTQTETFTRAGKFTAAGSTVGDIQNFSTVTLDGSKAEDISNSLTAKIVTKGAATWADAADYGTPDDFDIDLTGWEKTEVVTESLKGAVTLKNGASAKSITNFKSVTMTNSEVDGAITNVNKVTVKKGDSSIGSYVGTDDNDTVTIAKGAVLTANKIDLGEGAKDKLAINGTLILTGSEAALPFVNASNITGKGEIAVIDSLFEDVSVDFANILNVGETSEYFRGTASENADDTWKKAVKWDGKSDYNGWLGDWSGAKEGSDEVDFIKFKAAENAQLTIDGEVDWLLLDKKGNKVDAITAAGDYIIQLENKKDESTTYTINLA